jgi:hypothetical protein
MSQADSTNTTGASGAGLEGLYLPTDVSPEQVFQAIGRLRKEARDEVDRLIQFLDKTDDYVSRELEDQVDDSPCDDNELDGPENEEDEDDGLSEPSLGSCGDIHLDQGRWATGDRSDFEQDDGETGIGDQDGLDEQVPCRDWQGRGMV